MLANRFHSSMNFDPSLPNDSRRNFVKKSLAASIIAAQPTILAGLIRAQGGGGGTGTTDPWGGTEPVTEPVWTTDPWATTDPWMITDPWETTSHETTTIATTDEHTPKEWVFRLYADFTGSFAPPLNDNAEDLADRSGKIYTGTLWCLLVKCNGDLRTVGYPIETGGYCVSDHLDKNQDTDAGIPPGTWTVERNPKGWGRIPSGHYVDISIPDDGRDAILVHGPIRKPGTSGCIAITNATLFSQWSQLMRKPRCSVLPSCRDVDYPSPVELVVKYTVDWPNFLWKPANQAPAPLPNPYPPQYTNPAPVGLPVPVTPL
jgi:hypothetical protein